MQEKSLTPIQEQINSEALEDIAREFENKIPEAVLETHNYQHECRSDMLWLVGGEKRVGHWIDIYECQYCGNHIEFSMPIEEKYFN